MKDVMELLKKGNLTSDSVELPLLGILFALFLFLLLIVFSLLIHRK